MTGHDEEGKGCVEADRDGPQICPGYEKDR